MTLKCAVVGGGEVSTAHLDCLARHPGVDLRAVCDADETRAGDRASTYDIRAYGDFEGMLALETLDWIHLCTPTGSHYDQARLALEDDLALQIESPVTERADAARDLAALAAERDARVSVVHDGVFEPALQRASNLIEEGAIGTLRAVDLLHTGAAWPHEVGDREWLANLAGGAFEADLARPISQVVHLGGYPDSRSAIAAGGTRRSVTDDRFDFDGATFQYTTTDGVCCSGTVVASDAPRRVIRAHGDRGSLEADLEAGTVTVTDEESDESVTGPIQRRARQFLGRIRRTGSELVAGRGATGASDGEATEPRTTHEDQIRREVAALERGELLPVPLDAGVWTVTVMESIRSASGEEEEEEADPTPAVARVVDAD